jgi:hypothetical protein
MKLRWNLISKARIGRMLPLLVILTALLAAFPNQALAKGGHNGHNKHGNGHGHGHGYGPKHSRAHASRSYVAVPQRIYVQDRAYFRPYYTGRAYYAPHHHYHAAYRFPVYVGGVAVVRPYSYCGDAIFYPAPVVAPLPRLAFGITFGAPVGYYPQPGFSGSFVYVHHDD